MIHETHAPVRRRGRIGLAALGLGAAASLLAVGAGVMLDPADARAADPDLLAASLAGLLQVEIDLSKVQGAAACGECHANELEAWKKTTHFTTFNTMHRNPRATEIATALGISGGIKRNDLCLNCHYTSRMDGGEAKPESGVSCESCHGAAQDWMSESLHHEKAAKAGSEAERQAILKSCEEVGMLRPANVYRVAKNCFSCHTVPNEELVNKGGHKAGSAFELVSWSQGEVRHNYQHTEGGKNREATQERKRVLFVVGTFTDLEFSLRGLAKATDRNGDFYKAMKDRVVDAFKKSHGVVKLVEIPVLKAALPAFDNEVLKGLIGDGAKAKAAADKLSTAISAFAESSDGSGLGALDDKMPGAGSYHGTAHP